MFGKKSKPTLLTAQMATVQIPNWFQACNNGDSPIWSNLADISPHNKGSGRGVGGGEGNNQGDWPEDTEKWNAFKAPPGAPPMVFAF